MRIIPNDIEDRIQRALNLGECGDYEVISELAKRGLVKFWRRKDDDKVRLFGNLRILAAVNQNFEIRPPPPSTT